MTERSVGDLVVDRMHEMRHLVRAELHQRYKKTRPFREKKLTDKERLMVRDQLEIDDIKHLINEFGRENWERYTQDIEGVRRKLYGR